MSLILAVEPDRRQAKLLSSVVRQHVRAEFVVADSGTVTATTAYYVFRHFSQFVEPGAKRIDATGGDAVAFKNPDGSVVAMMRNSGSARTMTVAVAGKNTPSVTPMPLS